MIAEAVVEAVVAELLKGFNEADKYFSKTRDVFTARTGCLAILDFSGEV
jgi:hypothetical protein